MRTPSTGLLPGSVTTIAGVGDKDLYEVRELYKRLRELVIQNPGGWDDAASRERIEALCNAGIAALDDAECHNRLRTVRGAGARSLLARAATAPGNAAT